MINAMISPNVQGAMIRNLTNIMEVVIVQNSMIYEHSATPTDLVTGATRLVIPYNWPMGWLFS